MTAEILVAELTSMEEFFNRSTRPLAEEHSNYKPHEALYTVAQQVAHAGITIEWLVDGALSPSGFNMDFEKDIAEAMSFTSLAAARARLKTAFENARKRVAENPDVWATDFPPNPIMPGKKANAIYACTDHTAHHRGALTVYTRMLGLVPPMPYMEM